MSRCFNVEGACNQEEHYMINLDKRLEKIRILVENGKYFSINKARQYGKTTTLSALTVFLRPEYTVINLDFQSLSRADFIEEAAFVSAFAREVLLNVSKQDIPKDVEKALHGFSAGVGQPLKLAYLFGCLSNWCGEAKKPVVLMVDEVDSATNNEVFLDFLSQLRAGFLHRKKRPTFQSVILVGVYDIKNLRSKIRSEEEHKTNSPWNIAAEFDVEMAFGANDIAGMLMQYEKDYQSGMHVEQIAELIYAYTSGYPFLVSRMCKIMDEKIGVWTKTGCMEAVKILLSEKNTLFESLTNKLEEYSGLRKMLYLLLFQGQDIVYNPDHYEMDRAMMFGFIKVENGKVQVANRIFETRIYNMFLSENAMQTTGIFKAALQDKNQFIQDGHLNMDMVLEKFVLHFDDLYGDQPQKFVEEDGRRYFLLYLKPIINGTGNYYVESRTRDMRRTDVVIDYGGEQFVIEMKVWHGDEYNRRGGKQLTDYLDIYHLNKGYLLSFNFNKHKEIGVKEITCGDKIILEAVV